ncbi:unnamed protein product [Rotaria sp. Silwood2]|nr:unnamed protein product [Rotaria sp. Silwood2]
MGAFTPRDVCKMSESPLQLFDDQGKRSINDIGTPNHIEGNLSDKSFATFTITVFDQDNSRLRPVLIFKGKGQMSSREKSQYAHGTKDAHPKLLIADSANSHLNPDLVRDLRKKRMVVAIVPNGCTIYVQILDVSIFSVFKNHYNDVLEEYIEKNASKSKIRLTASQSRILCTRFTWSAWIRTLKRIDFLKTFHNIGYIWTDNSLASLRSMPGYTFDPTSVECLSLMDDNYDNEERIDIVAEAASEQQQQHTQIASTQIK